MKAEEILTYLTRLEKQVIHRKDQDTKTKYQVATLFRQIRKYVQYQVPMQPINISEDRTEFECPRCNEKLKAYAGDTVDDFNLCYLCGQRWKND